MRSFLALVILASCVQSVFGQGTAGVPRRQRAFFRPSSTPVRSLFPTTPQSAESTGIARARSSDDSVFGRSISDLFRDLSFFKNDFLGSGGQVIGDDGLIATADIPLAGGNSRFRIADNNKPVPHSRLFFDYRHFHNALEGDASQFVVGPERRIFNLDNYTFGFEKIVDEDEDISVQVRVPFSGRMAFHTPNFGIEGERAGNISTAIKAILLSDEHWLCSGGLGVVAPTGGSVTGQVNGFTYKVRNEAFHVAPFLGFMAVLPDSCNCLPCLNSCLGKLNERLSFQGFLQCDLPVSSHEITIFDDPAANYRESTLVSIDLMSELRFCSNPDAKLIKAISGTMELHYTTTIEDGAPAVIPFGFQTLTFTTGQRSDLLNLTAGLSTKITDSRRFGFGVSVPLLDANHRAFDAEFILTVNQAF